MQGVTRPSTPTEKAGQMRSPADFKEEKRHGQHKFGSLTLKKEAPLAHRVINI
jgi:hypothetical protein